MAIEDHVGQRDWQGELFEEFSSMAASLDEHISQQEVADKLRELADKLSPLTLATLDGATNEPAPYTEVKDAGEFAAMWNTRTPERREALFQILLDHQRRALDCFRGGHKEGI